MFNLKSTLMEARPDPGCCEGGCVDVVCGCCWSRVRARGSLLSFCRQVYTLATPLGTIS